MLINNEFAKNILLVLFLIRFSAIFEYQRLRMKSISPKYDEVVVNLVLELLTWNLTNFGNLGVKSKEIKVKTFMLCQISQFSNEEVKYQRNFWALVTCSDSVTRRLRNRHFQHLKVSKKPWRFLPMSGKNHQF